MAPSELTISTVAAIKLIQPLVLFKRIYTLIHTKIMKYSQFLSFIERFCTGTAETDANKTTV